AEDGIRDFHVTGVQTCALPIFALEENLIFFPIDNQRTYFHYAFRGIFILQTSQKCLYLTYQYLWFDGFGNIIIRTRIKTSHLGIILTPSGQEYYNSVT